MAVKSEYRGGVKLTGRSAEWFEEYITKEPSNPVAQKVINRALKNTEDYRRQGWKEPHRINFVTGKRIADTDPSKIR